MKKNLVILILSLFITSSSYGANNRAAHPAQASYIIAAGLVGAAATYIPCGVARNTEQREQASLNASQGIALFMSWLMLNGMGVAALCFAHECAGNENVFCASAFAYTLGMLTGLLPLSEMKEKYPPKAEEKVTPQSS